jgi:hypothetical protein
MGKENTYRGVGEYDPLLRKSIGFPGPGTYNNDSFTTKSRANTIIGNSLRTGLGSKLKIPGPQHYKIKGQFEKDYKTMAVMRNSYNGSRYLKLPTPGVGAYDLQKSMDYVMSRVAGTKIGNQRRMMSNGSPRNPGPAAYHL